MGKRNVTRRDAIKGAGGLAAATLGVGCASDDGVAQGEEDELIQCLWNGKGKKAKEKRGTFGNIEHVVVLMMENRSFDHYFGALSIAKGREDAYGNPFGGEGRNEVNGLTGDEWNPDRQGNRVDVYRMMKTQIGDINHEWDNCHRQMNWEGKGKSTNDGFVRNHEEDLAKGAQSYCSTYKYFSHNIGCPEAHAPMGIHSRADLPVMYSLADHYTLCDNWYASVLGPTWPNRFHLHAGTAAGIKGSKPMLSKKTIWSLLGDSCVAGTNYYCDIPFAHTVGKGFLLGTRFFDGKLFGTLRPFHSSQPGFGSFYNDVKNDNLQPFSVIDPGFSSGYDDHPPADIALGQAFISYVYRILASNPEVWKKTMLIITYDEHGSFYDHVVPPGNVPGSPQSYDENADFRQLGMRVPALIVSPYAKQGYVSHKQYDHCSILNTTIKRFDLANGGDWLNNRVKNTADLSDCIDPHVTPQNAPSPRDDIPVLEFSEHELMDMANNPFPDGQEGLAKMVESGEIPREYDLRPYRAQHMREFMEIGEKLGAFVIKR